MVNDVNNKATPYQPYVAFEMSAAGFSPKFVVGGGVIGDRQVRGRCNEKVLPGVTYTVFVRAFPRSSYNQESLEEGVGGRRRRQADVPRQYMVFSSSGFLSPVSTSELSLCLFVCLFVCLSVCMYVCMYVCTINQEIFIQDFFVFVIFMGFLYREPNVIMHFQVSNFSFFG